MQSDKHLSSAVFIYLSILMVIVIFKIIKDINILDIIYLVTLLCSVLKYIIVVRESRK